MFEIVKKLTKKRQTQKASENIDKKLSNRIFQAILKKHLLPEDKVRLERFKANLTSNTRNEAFEVVQTASNKCWNSEQQKLASLESLLSSQPKTSERKLYSQIALIFCMQAEILNKDKIYEENRIRLQKTMEEQAQGMKEFEKLLHETKSLMKEGVPNLADRIEEDAKQVKQDRKQIAKNIKSFKQQIR